MNDDDDDDMPPTPSTVSFTVRRPTPVSRPSSSGPESDGPFRVPALPRHLASGASSATGSPLAGSPRPFSSRGDSDDDEETGIVFVNGSVPSADDNKAPLVIPTQPNPDWRKAARRRRTEALSAVSVDQSTVEVVEETEDQRALRAILAGEDESAAALRIIPVSEMDALKQDVQELPDVATAADYERVPISDFGAAMLRGMGWSDGAVAPKLDKRRKNGLTKLYLPQARPALLGIGAKEQEPDDDGNGKKKPKGQDMRYIPVARKESGRGDDRSSRSGTVSRYSSHSPPRKEREDRVVDREKSAYGDRERRKERDLGRDVERRRTKDYDERDRDRDTQRDRARGRSDPYRDRKREGRGIQYDQRDRTRERDRRDRRDDP